MVTDVRSSLHLGEQSPDWALPRLDGGELRLSAQRGKQVLLFFWGSW